MTPPAATRLVLVPAPQPPAHDAARGPAKPIRRYRLARVGGRGERFEHLRRSYD